MSSPQEYLTLFPDWNDEIEFRRQWWTTIQKSIYGSEKRSSIITKPVRALSFTLFPMGDTKSGLIYRKLVKNIHKMWGVPFWQDETYLTADVSAGETILPVESTQYRNFEVNKFVMVYSGISDYEVGIIESFDATSITLKAGLSSSWSSGAKVFPILAGYLSTSIQNTMSTSNIGKLRIEVIEDTVSVGTSTHTTTSAPPGPTTTTAPPAPWLGTWKYRRPITVSSAYISEDLSNFPLALIISSAAGIGNIDLTDIFDEIGSSFQKIAITTADGITQCYVEVEMWNDVVELAALHVRVPTINSNSSTQLYLYYDAAQPDNTAYIGNLGSSVGANVWDDYFVGVYHLANDPASGLVINSKNPSSTSGFIHHNTPAWEYGKFGYCWNFNRDVAVFTDLTDALTEAFTVETVFNLADTASIVGVLVSKQIWPANNYEDFPFYTWIQEADHLIKSGLSKGDDFSADSILSTNTAVDAGSWYYAATAYAAETYHGLIVNGTVIDSAEINFTINSSSLRWTIGRVSGGSYWQSSFFYGLMDEVRISAVRRSQSWMRMTYYSLWDIVNAFGAREEYA